MIKKQVYVLFSTQGMDKSKGLSYAGKALTVSETEPFTNATKWGYAQQFYLC